MYNTNYLSSQIDWCENNFTVNDYIAEFVNSYSSLFISLCGFIGMYYYDKTFMLFSTLVPIGFGSYYFHSSLSEAGQMVDELSIMISISFTVWFINTYLTRMCNYHTMLGIIIFQITSMFIYPLFNRLILFIWAFITLKYAKLFYELEPKLRSSIQFIVLLFSIAAFCWVLDYMCIPMLYPLYLHGWWHVFIGLTAYYIFKGLDKLMYDLPTHI